MGQGLFSYTWLRTHTLKMARGVTDIHGEQARCPKINPAPFKVLKKSRTLLTSPADGRTGNQVTAYLRLENAKLATALEDLKKLEGPPDAAELYRATSLLGPSFAVHDHLADVNALFADASDRFHGDRCEDI